MSAETHNGLGTGQLDCRIMRWVICAWGFDQDARRLVEIDYFITMGLGKRLMMNFLFLSYWKYLLLEVKGCQ